MASEEIVTLSIYAEGYSKQRGGMDVGPVVAILAGLNAAFEIWSDLQLQEAKPNRAPGRLKIVAARNGSLVFDLVAILEASAAIVTAAGGTFAFIKWLSKGADELSKSDPARPSGEFSPAAQAAAKVARPMEGESVIFIDIRGGDAKLFIDSLRADVIGLTIRRPDAASGVVHSDVSLEIYRIGKIRATGLLAQDHGIVREISPNPTRLTFASRQMRSRLMAHARAGMRRRVTLVVDRVDGGLPAYQIIWVH